MYTTSGKTAPTNRGKRAKGRETLTQNTENNNHQNKQEDKTRLNVKPRLASYRRC